MEEHESDSDTDTPMSIAATQREQRHATSGMGFLLQQIRLSATAKSLQAPPEKKIRIDIDTNNDGDNFVASTSSAQSQPAGQPPPRNEREPKQQKVREDYLLPREEQFYTGLEPIQVVTNCFREGTTPDFGPHIRQFIGENNYVRSCKWSPDGQWLLVESVDHIARVFAFSNDKLTLHRKLPFGGLIYDFEWSPTGGEEFFATTSRAQPIHCWTPNGELMASFRGINDKDELDWAYSLCFSLGGDRIFAGYRNRLRLFHMERPGRQSSEIKTYEKRTQLDQKGIVSALAMCPTFDGVFAVGTFSGKIGLYSTHTNACDSLISQEENGNSSPAVTHLQYSSRGNLLFAGLRKSSLIQCYDLRMPTRLLANYQRSADTNQRFGFQLDPHDRYLYSGSSAGELLIYDGPTQGMMGQQQMTTMMPSASSANLLPPTHRIKCSRAAVTGLSLHPHDNLVAISTGQRVFPDLISRLFPADNDSPTVSPSIDPSKEEEQSAVGEEYTQMGKGSPLDNSIKLYRFKSC